MFWQRCIWSSDRLTCDVTSHASKRGSSHSSLSYVYWKVHHLDSWIKRDQFDVTCFIISLFNAQHVSDVNTSETCWPLNNEIIKQVTSSWSLFIQHPYFLLWWSNAHCQPRRIFPPCVTYWTALPISRSFYTLQTPCYSVDCSGANCRLRIGYSVIWPVEFADYMP